uniref:Uncharacterized protein n=1 Tax=Timema poppense TaxID=170557 RepID=A0A7R9GU22_TIMPO|nr:unnamed protein product [Timema poppensis]
MPLGKPKLRLVTYMCPSHPVELYELVLQYLEEQVGCEATLMYESRAAGPLPDRVDPFTSDTVDIAFLSSSAYTKLLDTKNAFTELLPVTPVFSHPKNKLEEKGYYSDIIIHIDGSKHIQEFLDLRGTRWAYSNEDSLSASTAILKKLKEQGENSSFFGDKLRSGSHLNSVQMVLTKQAEASAVDANTLAYNKKYLQDGGKDVIVLESIGPLPPYPIVANKRLSDAYAASFQKSVGHHLRQSGLSTGSAHTGLCKTFRVYPHKIHVAQLLPGELERCQTYCHWFMESVTPEVKELDDWYWSDKARFYLYGYVNAQNNYRVWSAETPYSCMSCPSELKTKIVQALLNVSQKPIWGKRLKKYGVVKFVANTNDAYQEERDIQDAVKEMSFGGTYY